MAGLPWTRKPLDLYPTPAEVALEIVRRVAQETTAPTVVLEPSAGPGRFVAAARATWPDARIIAADIDGAHHEPCLAAGAERFIESDWQALAARMRRERDAALMLILGNPPFNRAQAHVEAALDLLRSGEHLVFLLRLAFLGAEERVAWWPTTPLRWVATVIPRVSFTDGGNDMGEYGVFCWEKGYVGRPELAPHLLWGTALARAAARRDQLELIGRAG